MEPFAVFIVILYTPASPVIIYPKYGQGEEWRLTLYIVFEDAYKSTPLCTVRNNII